MKRSVVVLTILASLMTLLYHLNNKNAQGKKASSALSAPESPEAPLLIQVHKPSKSGIGNLDVWNMKPVMPFGQMMSLKDMFKPVYTLVKNGRSETLQRSDRSTESWELQGILMRNNKPRALLYNAVQKNMKTAGVGDLISEQLTLKSIASGRVTIEAKDAKNPHYFELHLYNTQKDIYAIKRKTQ